RSLPAREEECFIAPVVPRQVYWSTHECAELVPLQEVTLGCEKVPGVENTIADELEHTSMKFVCSRPRDDIDNCTSVIAVCRAVITRLNAELRNASGKGNVWFS